MTPARKVVLDASAVLAWVMNESGSGTIDRLLPVACVPASAMVETLYRASERGHGLDAHDLHAALLAMGIRVEPLIDPDTVRAAELIAGSRRRGTSGSLSLGDGLCIAVAERLDLPVVGGDHLWEGIGMTVPFHAFR
jgi:PIN domain nuclease of toxin-antitoxin system